MFLSQAINAAINGERFAMTEGGQKRDFVYVSDAADAIFRAAFYSKIEGEIINIGSGKARSLRSAAKLIWKITGASEDLLKIGERPTSPGENYDTQADIRLAAKILDWHPRNFSGKRFTDYD